jgi:hypothetical protein
MRRLAPATLAFAVACGAPPPAPGTSAPLPERRHGAPAAAAKPAARRDAIPPPEDLKMVVRVADAEQLRNELASFLPQLGSSLGPMDMDFLLTMAVGERLASTIDVAQPVDAAMIGGEAFLVSFGVKTDAEAKLAETFDLHDEDGMSVVRRPKGQPLPPALGSCAFLTASRPAMRLVCAKEARTVRSAANYLARTVAAEPLEADLRLTVAGSLFHEERSRSIRRTTDDAMVRGLLEAFEKEVDRFDLDLKFGGQRVDASVDMRFSARESPVARALVPKTSPTAPPPAFYKLPKDASFALHLAGGAADDLKPLRDTLLSDFRASMIRDGYAEEKVKPVEDQVASLFLTGGPLVVGAGVAAGVDGAERALAALDGAKNVAKAEAQARAALSGWTLAWVDEPAAKWTHGLRELVKRGDEAEKTRDKEIAKAAAPKDPEGDNTRLVVAKVDPKAKLPDGTLHVEVVITPRKKSAGAARKAHLFVAPKGASTWFAYGDDLAVVTKQLRFVLDDAATKGTLADVPEVAALSKEKGIGAAAIHFGGVPLMFARTTTSDDLRRAADDAKRAASLPGHGRDVITFVASSDVSPGNVKLGARTSVARSTLRDLVTFLAH